TQAALATETSRCSGQRGVHHSAWRLVWQHPAHRTSAAPGFHQRTVAVSGRHPIREMKRLETVLPDAVCDVLAAVGVAAEGIADERSRMSEIAFGRIHKRSLMGTLNDFAFMARQGNAQAAEPESPQELMRFIAQTPILPLDGAEPYRDPRRAHSERGWSAWHDHPSIPRSCVSARFAWCRSTPPNIPRNGPRFGRWVRSSDVAPRRSGGGSVKPSATPASDPV